LEEKEHILRIFKETKEAVKNKDIIKLKDLSNQTVHTASLNQNSESIAVAVIIYSISKILERKKYEDYPNWKKFYELVLLEIDNSINALKKNDEKSFKKGLTSIRSALEKLSGKIKEYIQEVFRKASINKASRIYEHGISLETTANLLGITLFELANYAGKTGISDVPESKTINIKQRIKLIEDFFA